MLRPATNTLGALFLLALTTLLAACSPEASKPAPPAAAAAPDSEIARNFAIGSLQATALRDGVIDFPNDNKILGVGRKPADVAAVLASAGLPADKIQLSLDPLLVKAGDRVLLFDTGAGRNFGGGPNGHLATTMPAANIDRKSITDVFISHVHGDHVGGLLDDQGAPAFPNATIHLSEPEWAFLGNQTDESARNLVITQYAALMAAMKPRVAAFKPGAEIIPGLVKAVEIKGHTPGHSGYLISSGDASLLYIGDALHHYVVSVQKPDWANGFDEDQAAAAASRAALLEQNAALGQRIYAVHFPYPGIGKFEKRGAGFVWVAE